ncbi:hypothetical protein RMSM_03983 [Rhodopirellula maiorica SM1]|uniref:Uncharacterized protein n=1 Tax=Rhodopirellula maiorica SM1 TaxID=1265738 RepID=M5RUL6_9BACT|nr:hypothetical protein RMSM_03983 [Rhodopirellula maiorica SM1]
MVAAAKAKQIAAWDHTADMMALMASIHTSNQYSRSNFHPYREAPVQVANLDDPGAEYDRLIAEQEKRGIK